MKDKILILIIGVLIGTILTAGGFLIYNNVKGDFSKYENHEMNGRPMMNQGERPELPEGEEPNGELPLNEKNDPSGEDKTHGNEETQNSNQKNRKNRTEKTETNSDSNQNLKSDGNA